MKRLTTLIGLGILAFNMFSIAPVQGGEVTPSCVTPPSGLMAWWQAEGNASDIINFNNGTPNGSLGYTNGEVGQAFVLDGNTYITVPASPSLDIGASGSGITIECWVKPSAANNPGGPIIEWDSPSLDGLEFWVNGDNSLWASMQYNSDNAYGLQTPANVVSTNVWWHVAVTYDKSSGIIVIYTNGVAAASANFGNITPETTFPLNIGRRTGQPIGDGYTYAGLIDELGIYNRALSQDEIQSIYNAGSAGKCTPPVPPVPVITSLSPLLGTNGAPVLISGTNFSATAADDIVYFGAVQATVLSASPTELVVTVPAGATYAPVTVTVDGLTAYSGQPFEPTFPGNGSGINASSFGPRLDLPSGNGSGKVVIADIDGDGKPDLIVANGSDGNISIYRNIGDSGSPLTADSFAPRVDLACPSADATPYDVEVADVDGDGKLDIIASDYSVGEVSVYQNTCTPGNINSNLFARVDFPVGVNPQVIAIGDMDGDGKPDLLVANSGDGTVSILRNTSVVGSLTANSFAPAVDITTSGSCDAVAVGDLDGDGKPDMVVGYYGDNSGSISLFRNISSPGSITADSFAPEVDLPAVDYTLRFAVADLDGDGKLDVVAVSYLAGSFSVFRNISTVGSLTTNSFAPRVDYSLGGRGHTAAVADFDGDGKPDLAVVTELDSLLSIFQNTSAPGSFTADSLAPRVDFSTGYNAWGVSAGDLNGDGRPDVVFCNNYDTTISIYQNTAPFNGPPVIQTQPENQTAVEGSSVALSVVAAAGTPLAYQWSFNGSAISGATNATLTLTNLHPAQAGNYHVRVANSFGAVTSSNATVAVIAQTILVYKYSATENITTVGQESSIGYSGEMFFIPASTNGTFVGWGKINGKKQFWVNPLSDYLLITIPVSAKRAYTMLGRAGQEIDGDGHPHIWSYLHKGLNTSLTIAKKSQFSFPETFSTSETHAYPDSQTGHMILSESVSTYTFAPSNTQAANNGGQTMADLVNTLTTSLVRQGYKQQ